MKGKEEITKTLQILEDKKGRLERIISQSNVEEETSFQYSLRLTKARIRVLQWVIGEKDGVEDNE